MAEQTDERLTFEGWCVIELMGHRRLAGYVTEVELAGKGFIRLDVPPIDDDDGDTTYEAGPATQFYSPAAVYAITPTTEEIARAVRVRPEPVHAWELPKQKQIPVLASVASRHDHDDDDQDDDDDDDDEEGF